MSHPNAEWKTEIVDLGEPETLLGSLQPASDAIKELSAVFKALHKKAGMRPVEIFGTRMYAAGAESDETQGEVSLKCFLRLRVRAPRAVIKALQVTDKRWSFMENLTKVED
jgi:hypothetical protein